MNEGYKTELNECQPPEKRFKQSSLQTTNLTPDIYISLQLLKKNQSNLSKHQVQSTSNYLNNNSNGVSRQHDEENGKTDNNDKDEENDKNYKNDNDDKKVVTSDAKKPPLVKSSVKNVFVRKLQEIKDLKKKELEVMRSIDGLDKQMADLLRKRREKVKQLKEIQKEERAVLNA